MNVLILGERGGGASVPLNITSILPAKNKIPNHEIPNPFGGGTTIPMTPIFFLR